MDSFSQQFFEFSRTVTSESRLRLAPTPSGFIHRGNALNFVLNWLAAKSSNVHAPDIAPAKIFLRIDDIQDVNSKTFIMVDGKG